MTKPEFISRQKAMTKSSNKWTAGFLVVFFGVLLANIPLAGFMDREKPASWVQIVYGFTLFGFLIGNIPLMLWFVKRQQTRFGVRCPSCGKPLVGLSAQVVVATGNCGQCGERIFNEKNAGKPSTAANPAIAPWLQSTRPTGRVSRACGIG